MSPTSSELMDEFETALRDALDEEASTVTAAPDALEQIRRRIERGDGASVRRPRSPWLGTRGAIAATVAVAAAAAAVGVVLSFGGSNPRHHIPPAHAPNSSISPTPGRLRVTPSVLGYTAVADSKLIRVSGQDRRAVRLRGPAGTPAELSDLQSPSPGLLYGIRSTGNCGAQLVRMRQIGGQVATVIEVSPGARSSVTGYAVDGSRLAVVETACDGSGGQIVSSDHATGASHTISWQGNPPSVVGNPAWVGPNALDLIWKAGTQDSPLEVDPFTSDSIATGAPACGNWDPATYLSQDLQGRGTNVFVVAEAAGGTTVLTCDPSAGPSVAFSLPVPGVAASASVQPNHHQRVLVADAHGRLWLWPGISAHKAHLVRNAPQRITAIAW